jgi:hypothetical protein
VTLTLDNRVRLAIYERFVDEGRPPAAEEVAAALDITTAEAHESYRRLHDAHVIVLMPGLSRIWMANPLSAIPTAFRVRTERGNFWGNCIWDALGAVAMLGGKGVVETRCADCDEPMTIRVDQSRLVDGEGLAHYAVPAAHWWDDIGFT